MLAVRKQAVLRGPRQSATDRPGPEGGLLDVAAHGKSLGRPPAGYADGGDGTGTGPGALPVYARDSVLTEPRASMNAEQARLDDAREKDVPWRKWGPYRLASDGELRTLHR